MRVKIISDGTIQGTKVVTDSGDLIENVHKIEWSADHDSGEIGAVVYFNSMIIEAECEAEERGI